MPTACKQFSPFFFSPLNETLHPASQICVQGTESRRCGLPGVCLTVAGHLVLSGVVPLLDGIEVGRSRDRQEPARLVGRLPICRARWLSELVSLDFLWLCQLFLLLSGRQWNFCHLVHAAVHPGSGHPSGAADKQEMDVINFSHQHSLMPYEANCLESPRVPDSFRIL